MAAVARHAGLALARDRSRLVPTVHETRVAGVCAVGGDIATVVSAREASRRAYQYELRCEAEDRRTLRATAASSAAEGGAWGDGTSSQACENMRLRVVCEEGVHDECGKTPPLPGVRNSCEGPVAGLG